MKKLLLALFISTAARAQYTSNMNLAVPPIGDTNYATKINSDLTLIDAHDHSSGKGVQIPTAGIANFAIGGAQRAAPNCVSSTVGSSAAITASTYTQAGLTVSYTPSGPTGSAKSILYGLTAGTAATDSDVALAGTSSNVGVGRIQLNDSVDGVVGTQVFQHIFSKTSSEIWPSSSFSGRYSPSSLAARTYTVTLKGDGTNSLQINNVSLWVCEQ